jgi:hypothetical protein
MLSGITEPIGITGRWDRSRAGGEGELGERGWKEEWKLSYTMGLEGTWR